MIKKYSLGLLVITMVWSLIGVQAQQPAPPNDETKIRDYQAQIQLLMANAPAPGSDAETKYRAGLQSLSSQLRDLLLEKRGALKSKISNLQGSSSTEIKNYVEALRSELLNVNSDVTKLENAMGQAGAIVTVVQPQPQPSPSPLPPPTNAQVAFETTVKNLAAKDLTKEAAPAVVAASADPATPCRPASAGGSKYDRTICSLAVRLNNQIKPTLNLSQNTGDLFTIMVAKLLKTNSAESYVTFITEAQEARVDQQVGSGPGSKGTTSLVVKGGVPYLFGLAVENGAATQSESDTTITYRVNPGGMVNMLGKKGFITGYKESQNDPFLKFLGKTSLGFTFDTSRGNTPGVFTGDKQQLSAFSARVEFVNERDPRLKKYERDWEEFVATHLVNLGQVLSDVGLALTDDTTRGPVTFKDSALQAWKQQSDDALNDAVTKAGASISSDDRINLIAGVIRQRADLLPVDLVSEETKTQLRNFAEQYLEYTTKKKELLDRIARGKIFTIEYTNTRGVNAPDLSNINFIAATGMGARIDLTANGSFTFFNKVPGGTALVPKPGRIRDFQFAGQLTVPFKFGESQFDFWFSGRYERLVENASTVAGTIVPGTKGDIAVGQFGLNIPIKSLGIKFPVSVTFANRTELIKEKEVRGNIGFTFNWDTLFSKLKPF